MRGVVLGLGLGLVAGCNTGPFPPGATLSGTWGGNYAYGNPAKLEIYDSTRVLVGCSHGFVLEPIVLDGSSRFDVAGEQNIAPSFHEVLHPTRVTGSIDGRTMTLTVTLTDTAYTLGPVSLTFGKEPTVTHLCGVP